MCYKYSMSTTVTLQLTTMYFPIQSTNQLTNHGASPCCLFLATFCVISVSLYSCFQSKHRGEIIKSKRESLYPTLSVQPQKQDALSTSATSWWTLNRHWWVKSWWLITSTDPNLRLLLVLRARGNCAVVREEISEGDKLLRVSAPWRALLRYCGSHLFRFLPLTAGAFPI